MKRAALLMCSFVVMLNSVAQAQAQAAAPDGYMYKTTDQQSVLNMLKGSVDLYGVNFGSSEFQRGILRLLSQRVITVRVMTTSQAAANFKPLRALGAGVYTLPANYTNSLIAVKNGPLIFIDKSAFQVIPDANNAASAGAFLQQYWKIAKSY